MYRKAVREALAFPDHHLRVTGSRHALDQSIPHIAAAINKELGWLAVQASTVEDATRQLSKQLQPPNIKTQHTPDGFIQIVQSLAQKDRGIAFLVDTPERALDLLVLYQYPDVFDTGNVMLVTFTEEQFKPAATLEPLFRDAALYRVTVSSPSHLKPGGSLN